MLGEGIAWSLACGVGVGQGAAVVARVLPET